MAATPGQFAQAVAELPRHWWVLALRGLSAIIFGILTFAWPGITLTALIYFFGAYAIVAFFWPSVTALALLYLIAAWAIVTGVVELIAAVRLRQVITNEWALIFSGVLSVLLGVALVLQPDAGVWPWCG